MNLRIDVAGPDDLPPIAAIDGHHVRQGLAIFEVDPPTVDEMRARPAASAAAGYPVRVARQGTAVLGLACASAFRSRPADRCTVEDPIGVDPTAVGSGIGEALLTRPIGACETLGDRQMLAVIGDSDNRASIALRAACGFGRTAVFVGTGFRFGRWIDTVIMQRAVGAGNKASSGGSIAA